MYLLCVIEIFMFFRYFLVQKAKEAKIVGILVGTLGAGKWKYSQFIIEADFLQICAVFAANYLAIIERLKQILKDAGKKVLLLPTTALT